MIVTEREFDIDRKGEKISPSQQPNSQGRKLGDSSKVALKGSGGHPSRGKGTWDRDIPLENRSGGEKGLMGKLRCRKADQNNYCAKKRRHFPLSWSKRKRSSAVIGWN